MTNEELAMRIKAGESELMSELWTQVERFVAQQARKFFSAYMSRCQQLGLELEDIQQEGFFGIQAAVEDFDSDKGVLFLTYAGYNIKRAFFRAAKMDYRNWQSNTAYQAVSIDEPLTETGGTLAATLESPENVESEVIDRVFTETLAKDLGAAIANLSQPWAETINAIYFTGIRPVDLARRAGITRTTVSRKHRRALKALSRHPALAGYAS